MDATELREEYRQAIASPLILSELDPESGLPFILYNNNWVRILLVRRADDSPDSIEVELSVSERCDVLHMDHHETVSRLISYLNYILLLHDRGFKLDSMEDDVLWTASLDVSAEPDIELFEILLPSV
ncbi:MAG: hypothetical protein ACFFF9_15335 [Candidatus Thorarchaeota archaeon]